MHKTQSRVAIEDGYRQMARDEGCVIEPYAEVVLVEDGAFVRCSTLWCRVYAQPSIHVDDD